MNPRGLVARRFPLIARPRPACLPVPDRIAALTALADVAVSKEDLGVASTIHNQAALLASDLGLPDLARSMCHQHAAAYLSACPLTGRRAVRALEPVVNLARLRIRAGDGDEGRRCLLALHETAGAGTAACFEGVAIPVDLVATDDDRREVHAWLWRVLLADGTRTLTTAGRWAEALDHIERHHGVGMRMLDGRQVAVLAALTAGDTDQAADLLAHTAPGEKWEQQVASCLTVLCRLATGQPAARQVADLAAAYSDAPVGEGMTVFDIRLGLTILDSARHAGRPAARDLVHELHRRVLGARDGYAAREALADSEFTRSASEQQVEECRELMHACGLGSGHFPDALLDGLAAALRTSDRVIRKGLATPT